MKRFLILFIFSLMGTFTVTYSASLANVLYARYVCRSKPNGYKAIALGSCTQYYECQFGRSQPHSCPRYFDSAKGICVASNPGCVEPLRAAVNIPAGCTGPCCGVSNGYILDPVHLQIYYKCNDNCVEEKNECDGDLVFNLVKMECDRPSNCGSVTTPKPPCATDSSSPIATKSTSAVSPNSFELYMRYVCRDKPNGYLLISVKSCNEYYVCQQGAASLLTCGDKYFNVVKGMCDLPKNTKCVLG